MFAKAALMKATCIHLDRGGRGCLCCHYVSRQGNTAFQHKNRIQSVKHSSCGIMAYSKFSNAKEMVGLREGKHKLLFSQRGKKPQNGLKSSQGRCGELLVIC